MVLLVCIGIACILFRPRGSQPDFSSVESTRPSAAGADPVVAAETAEAKAARWAYLSDKSIDSEATRGMEWHSAQDEVTPERRIIHAGSALLQERLHWYDLPQTAHATGCSDDKAQRIRLQNAFCGGDSDCLRPDSERGRWFSDEPVIAGNVWTRWFAKPSPSIAQIRRSQGQYCYQLWNRPLVVTGAKGLAALDVFSERFPEQLDWTGDGVKRALGPLHYPWQEMLLADQEPGRHDWLAVSEVDWADSPAYQEIANARRTRQQRTLNKNVRALWAAHGGGDGLLWRIDKRQPDWPWALRAELPLQWLFYRDDSLSQLITDAGVYQSALALTGAPVQARMPAIDKPDHLKQWLDRLMASGFDGFSLWPVSLNLRAWPILKRYSDQVLDAIENAHAVADVFVLGELPDRATQEAMAEHGLTWLRIHPDDYADIETDPTGYRLGQLRSRALLSVQTDEGAAAISEWAQANDVIVWQHAVNVGQVKSPSVDGTAMQTLGNAEEWNAWLSSMASDFRFRLRQPVSDLSIAKWERPDALLVWVSNDGDEAKVLSLMASADQLAVLQPESAQWLGLKPLRNRWEVPLAAGESRWLSFQYQAIDLPLQRRLQPVFEQMMSVDDVDFVNGSFETELELPMSWEPSGQGFSLQLTEIGGGVDVLVNGRDCGAIEFAPKRLDLTSCVEAGVNSLRIKMRPPLAADSELKFLQHF